MTNIAIVANDFTVVANVFAIMTTKTTDRVEVSDIIRVRLPIGFHFRKEVGLENPLYFCNCTLNGLLFLRVDVGVVSFVETIERCRDGVNRFIGSRVLLTQDVYSLLLNVRKCWIQSSGRN